MSVSGCGIGYGSLSWNRFDGPTFLVSSSFVGVSYFWRILLRALTEAVPSSNEHGNIESHTSIVL